MKTALIVVAAGSGKRLGATVDKPYVMLSARPLVWHGLKALDTGGLFDQRIVVIAPGSADRFRADVLDAFPLDHTPVLVDGGANRQQSVLKGLEALDPGVDRVAIHDAARPCVTAEWVRAVLEGLTGVDGAVLALPVHDALKSVEDNLVIGDVDRRGVWRMQTPQVFHTGAIVAAHKTARRERQAAPDDASLVIRRGGRVRVVRGSHENIKVTTREDLRHAEIVLGARHAAATTNATGPPREGVES